MYNILHFVARKRSILMILLCSVHENTVKYFVAGIDVA